MIDYANLTTDQIDTALKAAKALTAAKRNGNVYNQIRAGLYAEALGSLRAGDSKEGHKKARYAFRRSLHEQGLSA